MPDQTPGLPRALHDWHRRIHADGEARDAVARRLGSQLRRCRSIADARLIGGLYSVLNDGGHSGYPRDWQVLAVWLLPYLGKNTDDLAEDGELTSGTSLSEAAARSGSGGDRPRVSDRRFRRLIEHETLDDLAGPLLRALQLVGEASLSDLAKSLRFWYPDAAHHPRTDWAHDYYTTLLHA